MGKMNLLKANYEGKVGQTVGAKWKNVSTLRTFTKPSNPNTDAQQTVRSGKVCCVNFNLVHTTKKLRGILLTLPSTVPIPKEPVYFTLYDSMRDAS